MSEATPTAPAATPPAAAPTTPSLTAAPTNSGGGAPRAEGGNPPGGENGTPPPGNVPEVKFPENWKQALPKEFQDEPSLKLVNDVPTLAKNYINAQKMIGADKIALPGKHATEDDWKQVWNKLGMPQDVKDFNIKAPEGAEFNPEFISKFKDFAHKNGVLPKQAEGLLSWYHGALKEQNEGIAGQTKVAQEQEWNGLREKWGKAFDNNVLEAQMAFKTFADDETTKFLNETGLANNPKLVALFAKIGQATREDALQAPDKRQSGGVMTPDQAKEEMNKVYANTEHPYFNKQHPNHKAAVQEMEKFASMAYPPKPKN